MATRKVSSRTVLNRKALNEIAAGFADGMEEMGQAWVAAVDPPDAAPFAEGLIETPDWGVWGGGKKIAGTAAKPRGANVKQGLTLIAGAGFPARFNVMGTIDTAANPGWFIGPMDQVIDGASSYIAPKVKARLARVK